jgi:transposase-like protein
MPDDLSLGLLDERFIDPLAAADYLESLRWPNGPVCPHCGESERKAYRLPHKTRRLWKCAACRKQFTVTVGTIFERSHVGLNKWLLPFYLLCSSKKGMSSHQLGRMLGVTYKTAWFMTHRIRYAMTQPAFTDRLGGVVEVDETYVGGKERNRKFRDKQKKLGRGTDKAPVVALVERGGKARSMHIARVTGEELKGAIRRHVTPEARIMTDSFPSYRGLDTEFASHETVNHWKTYVDGEVHTNTVENFFSILKRGIDGVYHHVSEAHLHRYLSEFDFRYNARKITDAERTRIALLQTAGKRLQYGETLGG